MVLELPEDARPGHRICHGGRDWLITGSRTGARVLIAEPEAGDRNNWQLQLGEVFPPQREAQLAGLTASYAAIGACMLYLPREQLARYTVQRLLADALERSTPVGIKFSELVGAGIRTNGAAPCSVRELGGCASVCGVVE